jgi:hypothetical protein
MGDLLSQGWELWKRTWAAGALVVVAQGLLLLALSALPAVVFLVQPWNSWPSSPFDARWLVGAAGLIIYLLLSVPLSVGLTTIFIDAARTGEVTFAGFWSGFRQWGSVSVTMVVWFLASMLPYVGYLTILATPVLMAVWWALADRQRGIVDAVLQVKPLLERRYWWVLGITLLAGLIGSVGALLCGVGMLATWPLSYLIESFLYLHLAERLGWTGQDRRPPTGMRLVWELAPMSLIALALLAAPVVVYLVWF